MPPRVSLILIHYRQDAMTAHVLRRLSELPIRIPFEVAVVDNGSGTAPPIPQTPFPCMLVRLERNMGYAAACNRGAAATSAPLLFFLNNDIDFSDDFIAPLASALEEQPECGLIGPALRFPDGRFQLSWGERPGMVAEARERTRQRESRRGGGPHYARREAESRNGREVDWVTGAAMLMPRDLFETLGGFDEGYFFYFEDVDLCARVRAAGRRVRYEASVPLIHFGGGSQREPAPELVRAYRLGQLRYYSRHASRVSFSLLKAYLSFSVLVRAFRDPASRPLLRDLFGHIRRSARHPHRI